MRAILVSVDYTDFLKITLPYNREHFDEVTVVTSIKDRVNVEPVCDEYGVNTISTDLFYERGAVFNKWAAMEYGLDEMGRDGWICIIDADILLPKICLFGNNKILSNKGSNIGDKLELGKLYGPLRHMMTDPYEIIEGVESKVLTSDIKLSHDKCVNSNSAMYAIPQENRWGRYPLHGNQGEWAGYMQVFHGSDPVLGKAPWHETNWSHAGGADSFFQKKWSKENKVRTPWNVLHLGLAGVNWAGRTTKIINGEWPAKANERRDYLRRMMSLRHINKNFDGEKI